MSGWKPIETAPKDGRLIDLWVRSARMPDCFWRDDGDGDAGWEQKYAETSRACSFALDTEPTHWMPLPEPPK